jgi:hypothetical protein
MADYIMNLLSEIFIQKTFKTPEFYLHWTSVDLRISAIVIFKISMVDYL